MKPRSPVTMPPFAGLNPDAPVPAPTAPGARLPRRERLRGRFRFDALFAAGRVGQTKWVTVRALPTAYPLMRAAFLVGKGFGKAVVRGRLRRRLRALYRQRKSDFPPGWDVAILPRRGADAVDAATLARDLALAIGRATSADGPATGSVPPKKA